MSKWQYLGLASCALALAGAVAFQWRADASLAEARDFVIRLESRQPRPIAPLPKIEASAPGVHFRHGMGIDPFNLSRATGHLQ